MEQLLAHAGTSKLSRDQLVTILPPEATDTFKPIAHAELIHNLLDGLSYRHINVVRDEYAVSDDGMKLFGVLDLETTFDEARFSLGIRNANDKSMRLALTVGYRVFVCDNMAFLATLRQYWLSTRSTSTCRMRWLSALTASSATSSLCGGRLSPGAAFNLATNAPNSPSTGPSSRATWRCRNTLPGSSIRTTSNRSTRSSHLAPFGASRMPLLRHSRNWTRSRNSARRPSWADFWQRRRSPRGAPPLTSPMPSQPFPQLPRERRT